MMFQQIRKALPNFIRVVAQTQRKGLRQPAEYLSELKLPEESETRRSTHRGGGLRPRERSSVTERQNACSEWLLSGREQSKKKKA